ncbi:amidase [Bacillus sp. REN10]|uniref:amidase n=1 Tax=Bacillus sp. REN10 TaxID=2782541 RepID=UPI00193BBECA|nr:amidase [Bacillus sp. REN10]
MNKLTKFIWVLIAVFVLESAGFAMVKPRAAANEQPLSKATWLWHTKEIVSNKESLLNFMQQNQVTDVYLQINKDISASAYKAFIKQASAKHIKVHALDGAPSWVSSNGVVYQERFFTWLNNYQLHALPEERFSGVHLDVEPYLYKGWKKQYQQTVRSYQSLLIQANQFAQQLGVPLAVDIPFWFDKRFYDNQFGTGKLSDWVITHVNSVTIMAYRDQALGSNGIIKLVQDEINYAASVNKRVSIGVETLPSKEGEFISFYEEGKEYMWEQLQIVQSSYKHFSSFGGFSIHSLQGWMNLKQ